MRFLLTLALLCLLSHPARADTIEDVTKRDFSGYDLFAQTAGDLNGDSKTDYVAIMFKPAKSDDEQGEAMLAIYLADGDKLKLHTKADKAICVGCGGPKAVSAQPFGDLSITGGVLNITLEGGSREEYTLVEKWRLDKKAGKFILIGESNDAVDTAGEEPEDIRDINYSTLKMDRTIGGKKRSCKVDPQFKGQELSTFDYENKHIDDLGKIDETCL